MSVSPLETPLHRSGLRLLAMLVIGVVTAVLVGSFGSWDYAPALGCAAAAAVFLVLVWSVIGKLNPAGRWRHPRREDPGRTASDVLVLAATIASFGVCC